MGLRLEGEGGLLCSLKLTLLSSSLNTLFLYINECVFINIISYEA